MKRIPFIPSLPLAVFLIFGALAFSTGSAYGAWQLVWSDDFTNANGSLPDPTKWTYDTGGGGWGNNELETYTTTNATIQNTQLVIQVNQIISGPTTNYTSTRMKTQGLWSWPYGRMEARIKIPYGQGMWPAFWMLGTNIVPVGWPGCGEIDIMENIGKTPSTVYGTIHGPQNGGDYNGGSGVGGSYSNTVPLANDFHVYAVQWTTNQIQWFIDTNLYFTATPASLPGGGAWVFTNQMFIILNVAVGGQWPGNPDATTVFPQQMLVDYVHVYTYVASVPDTPTGLTVGAGNAAAYLSWGASTGATAYNVKRAMNSGGPYTTIATPTANSYVDTGVSTCDSYYYVVSATNSLGESPNSSEAAVTLGAFALAVNSGGGTAVQFIADTSFTGGTVTGGTAASTTATIDTSAVTNPAPQAVYQTERYGNCTYTFTNLTQGVNYTVRLHFAEIYWTATNDRLFNVSINGKQVLTNFDVFAVTGAEDKANVQQFTVTPTTTNTIVITYTTVKDNAKSSGIEILLPPPVTPVGLTATASNSLVTLRWNASSVATSYNVKRSLVSGGPYTLLSGGLTNTNYTDSVVTNGTTYYYVVSAVNAGCESTNSIQVSATPACTPPAAPTAGNNGPILAGATLNLTASTVSGATYSWTGPNGFTSTSQNPSIVNATTSASGTYSVTATVGGCTSPAGTTAVTVNLIPTPTGLTATAGNTQVALSWNASSGATSYNVKSSTTNGGPYVTIASPTTAGYTNTGLVNGTTYYYVVSAVNSACESTNSTQVSATPVCTPPAAPTAGNNGPIWAGTTLNLTASTVSGATYSWTGPNGFTSTSQNPSIVNATTSASGTYSVTATVGGCTSPAGTTAVVVNLIPAPAGLTATPGNSLVTLSWNPSTAATGYNVKRSLTNGGPYTLLSGGLTVTNYTDSVVTNGTTYYYVVSATNSACESTNSTQVSTTPGCTPPAAPAGLTATGGDSLVTLSWNPSTGAIGYNAKRSLVNGGPYTLMSGGLTGTNCTDSVVTNGTTYYYVVSALNAGCESTNSIQASAMPINHPPVLAAISNQTIMAGRTLLVTNSASDADSPPQTLTFSLLTAPTNAAINSSSGLFTWRPIIAQSPSTQGVSVVVADNGTPIMSATQGFTVTVTQPAVPALNAVSITNGQFGFLINGSTGPDYTILASTNLTSWNPVFTGNSLPVPYFWVDTNSLSYPIRFYRTVLGP